MHISENESSFYFAKFATIPGDYRVYFHPHSMEVKGIYVMERFGEGWWLPQNKWRDMRLKKFRAVQNEGDIVFANSYITEDWYIVSVPYINTNEAVDHFRVRQLKTLENIQAAITFASI